MTARGFGPGGPDWGVIVFEALFHAGLAFAVLLGGYLGGSVVLSLAAEAGHLLGLTP